MGHPYFVSALAWHTRFDEALADAAASARRVLAVIGRPLCSGTRAMVERTLAKEELEAYTPQKFVLLAADADALEPRLASLVEALPQRNPTPLCVYITADGRALLSTAGGRPPAVLLNDMLNAVTRK